MTKEQRTLRADAFDELTNAIEDVFYTASLFRAAGDHDAAKRLGDLGDKMHDEYMLLRKGTQPS